MMKIIGLVKSLLKYHQNNPTKEIQQNVIHQ